MSDAVTLSRFISVRHQFLRSAHVERDYHGGAAQPYYYTEAAAEVLQATAAARVNPSQRAMAVIGPYGAGKSAFCVFLARLLSQVPIPDEEPDAAGLTATALARTLLPPGRPLVPVFVVGSRRPLGVALVDGLLQSLEREGRHALLAEIRPRAVSLLQMADSHPQAVADLYTRAARLARESEGADGLILIIDEMGKFLEHAVLHPRQGDIFALQELAEAAARSPQANPLLVLTVVHQSPDAYAQKLGPTQQAEWAKVGERFRQVPFFPSDRERIGIIGRVLEHAAALRLPPGLDDLSRQCLLLRLAPPGLHEAFSAAVRAAYPLHPVTLLALPALFRRTGQSHRSVFNFLSGQEQASLVHFLDETLYDPLAPPLYPLDRLFDYAAGTLVGGWSAPTVARMWSEAGEAIERAEGLSPLARRVLKCIGLLGLVRDSRLPASPEILEAAMTEGNGQVPPVSEALEELTQRRLILYSRVRKFYRLWEGGDVDIEAELTKASAGLGRDVTLHAASVLCPAPPLVARRHSYETGTLRPVSTRPCSAPDLPAALARADDLTLLLCLVQTPEEAENAQQTARGWTRPNALTAIGVETEALRLAAREIAAAAEVAKNPALDGDRPARRELAARRMEAEATFRAEWGRLFGPGNGGPEWLWRGKSVAQPDRRAFSSFLSKMAGETYHATPRLRNEMLNRPNLSTAAAAGRRALIERMLTHGSEERLGLAGYPPEVSMYECVLRATGVHRPSGEGAWEFGPPPADAPAGLRPAWDAMGAMLFAGPPVPRPLPDVWRTLRTAPYGLTEGVLPVLLCAFLLAYADETTLYREGTFLAEPRAGDWELLLRRPEMFSVTGCRVSGDRALVVERLARGLKTRPAVVPVVRALLRNVHLLPEHAWKTRRLPAPVPLVRDAFEHARSPERLLFMDLPFALGVTVLSGEEVGADRVEPFFQMLNAALRDWSEVTPRMQARVRADLLAACGYGMGEAAWQELRQQCALLESRVTHPALLPFTRRAASPGDGATVLDSVLAFLADRPPRTWSDPDCDRAIAQARVVGELFRQAAQEQKLFLSANLAPQEAEASRQLAEKLKLRYSFGVKRRVLRAALITWLQDLENPAEENDANS